MAENSTSPLEELKNLLEDLQAKKSRESLRMPSRATRRALLQADFTPREPDQKTVERHLRAIYRQELADLFEKACRRLLFEDEVLAREIYDDGTVEALPISSGEWESAACSALDTIPEGALEDDPLGTVRLLLDRKRPSMTEVAKVGRGLRPLPAFDLYMGLDAMARGDLEHAESVLRGVYTESPFESARQDAACNLGEVAHLRGDVASALTWFKENAESSIPWSLSPVHWLFNAIYLGDEHESLRASETLREFPLAERSMADYVRRMRASRYCGDWGPSAGASRIIRSCHLAESENVNHVKELFK